MLRWVYQVIFNKKINQSLINLSNRLQITHIKPSGILFSNIFPEPFINNDMMFTSFHSNGIAPYSNDKLNTVASDMLICCTILNRNLGGIPSNSGDLLSFISFILLLYN